MTVVRIVQELDLGLWFSLAIGKNRNRTIMNKMARRGDRIELILERKVGGLDYCPERTLKCEK